jgi:hypothetical protein
VPSARDPRLPTPEALTLPEPQLPHDPSRDTAEPNPFGLEILYEPKTLPANPVQIVFVHGLGGSKRGTWTHGESRFWPDWLPDEKGLENVRIATFGYNSAFNVLEPNTNLSIPIFANQLLFSMSQLNYRQGSVQIHFTPLIVGSDHFHCP